MVNRFILNEVSYFGPGARKELPGVVARLGFKKALVVTDKGLVKFGVAKMVTDVLDEAGIPYELYSEVKPNPTVTNVKMGVKAFADAGADFIVAIGGGSSMDTARAARWTLTYAAASVSTYSMRKTCGRENPSTRTLRQATGLRSVPFSTWRTANA